MRYILTVCLFLFLAGCGPGKPAACIEFRPDTDNETILQMARSLAEDDLWKIENEVTANSDRVPNIGMYTADGLRIHIVGSRDYDQASFLPRATFYIDDARSEVLEQSFLRLMKLAKEFNVGPVNPCGGEAAVSYFRDHTTQSENAQKD